MNIADHYRVLVENSKGVLESMLDDVDTAETLTISHNYLIDYGRLKLALGQRPEAHVLDAAVKEYQFALFALAAGRYRHAFVGLRLFFELMLVTVQFSAHEIDYRMWSQDSKDINWNALKDPQSGVFAVNFIKAFNEGFACHSKEYLAIAEHVYRECSEYVHGNAKTHVSLPAEITFNKDMCLSWHEKSKTMRMVIVFAFSARYLGYIDSEAQNKMESTILDVLGHLPIVQEIFSRAPQE